MSFLICGKSFKRDAVKNCEFLPYVFSPYIVCLGIYSSSGLDIVSY